MPTPTVLLMIFAAAAAVQGAPVQTVAEVATPNIKVLRDVVLVPRDAIPGDAAQAICFRYGSYCFTYAADEKPEAAAL